MTIKSVLDVEERNAAAAAKCRAAHSFPPKLSGWDFYRSIGSPKHIIAPMVKRTASLDAWHNMVTMKILTSVLCYVLCWFRIRFLNRWISLSSLGGS